MKAAALSIPAAVTCGFPDRNLLVGKFSGLSSQFFGRSTVAVFGEAGVVKVFRLLGRPLDRSRIPSPYAGFAIRARFPIFGNGSAVKLTAHLNSGIPCPFTCDFCSESRLLQSPPGSKTGLIGRVVGEMRFLKDSGAEAVFFDDSVFLGGSLRRVMEFADVLQGESDLDLEWGAQFTVSVLDSFDEQGMLERCLRELKKAGCSYLYFGLESLSSRIMSPISKTLRISSEYHWQSKVVDVLRIVKNSGIRAGASILFGLKGETLSTVDETIKGVTELLNGGLLSIVSPNLMTYHPGTKLTTEHNVEERLSLRYSHLGNFVRPPYAYFEEAFPGLVSRELHEDLIWHIHQETQKKWGLKRNFKVMPEMFIPGDYI
jgi:biotin synthase-like enzyme